MAARAQAIAPARRAAFAVVRRVFEAGAYADRALASEAAGLDPRDRALAMQIAYGTVQRKATLDHLATQLASRELDALDPAVLAAIRIGLFQLLYLRAIPAYAAVSESVELAKRSTRGGAGMVNAVLRRAAADPALLLDGIDDCSPERAAIMHSVPVWLAEMWWTELGAGEARALLARTNEPAESALRVNTLLADPEVASRLPVPARRVAELPEALVLEGPFDLQGSELWRRGCVMAQSRASMLVSRVAAPRPGDEVLDLCAAPGGKTTHMAALMESRGMILAVERHPGRAAALERTARRMRADCVRVRVADARGPVGGRFDRVLVDPPCSGLGTLQSRPDRRWRVSPGSIAELAELQAQLLRTGAAAVREGGEIVYAVCTISREEGDRQITAFLAAHPEFEACDLGAEYPQWRDPHDRRHLQLLPHRDLTDGFFIARLRRH